jgi:hypothetical protein
MKLRHHYSVRLANRCSSHPQRRFTRRLLLSTAMLSALMISHPLKAQPTDPCQAATHGVTDVDRLHPFNYVNLFEITRHGERFPIHISDPDTIRNYRRYKPHSYVEVDRNSTLELSFSRRWIASQPDFEGRIHVTGTLNGEPLPIPGYSEVGERADTGRVNLQSNRAVIASFCSLDRSTGALSAAVSEVAAQVRYADSIATTEQRQQFLRVSEFESRIESLEEELADADSASKEELQAEIERLNEGLNDARNDQDYEAYLDLFTRVNLTTMRTSLEQVAPIFETLTDRSNAAAVDLMARRVGRNPRMITTAASRLTAQLDSIRALGQISAASDRAARRRAGELVIRLGADLKELVAVSEQYLQYLRQVDLSRDPALLEELKDSRILLSRHEVKRGDRVIITVLNRMSDDEENHEHRELDLDIRVDRFGWDSDVTDSFIFLRRLNAEYEALPPSVATTERAFALGTAERDTTIRIDVGVNFDLIPGASFLWSHRSRREWTWLKPSFGLNVSFPKFQTKSYHISRPEGEDATVSRIEETTSNTFDLAIGGVATLFDGSIGVTLGRVATVQRAPWYWGVSLSFLALAKNAAKVLAGS